MKKLLLFLFFSATIFFTAQAGYVIRGINAYPPPESLKNYTLTIDGEGNPLAAASMYTLFGGGSGRNTIVIIPADNNVSATGFSIVMEEDEDFDIEVRDFHYVSINNTYMLCGARITENYSYAFVAEIDGGFNSMNYMEYSEAEIFYSICVPQNPSLDYYVCGKFNTHGVIVSISRSNLYFTHFVATADEYEWEYHKIIEYSNPNPFTFTFAVSGRNPHCTQIGFTTIDWQLNTSNNYYWAQNTEPDSHCVVCNHPLASNTIVMASSYQNSVSLYAVTPSSPTPTIISYYYTFSGTDDTQYCVQDIGMFQLDDVMNPPVSVAGYKRDATSIFHHQAWYGTTGFVPTAPMQNRNYSFQDDGRYEHYKIRYDQHGKLYTGGYFENGLQQQCALFGSPRITADDCDIDYPSLGPNMTDIVSFPFYLTPQPIREHIFESIYGTTIEMIYDDCRPFKGGGTPELAPAIEDESELITFYDRITVKDTPTNTNYQIFTILGQLIQSGTTTPDISTAQLSSGIYILRLENGKVYKFVK